MKTRRIYASIAGLLQANLTQLTLKIAARDRFIIQSSGYLYSPIPPYAFNRLYNVFVLIPSICAASVLLPCTLSSVAWINSFSTSSMVCPAETWLSATCVFTRENGDSKLSGSVISLDCGSLIIKARWIAWRSSRTLPGHSYCCSSFSCSLCQ